MQQLLQNKKIIGSVILGIIIILVAIFVLLPGTQGSSEVMEGQTVVITVNAAALDQMYAYQFNMNFNSEEFEFIEGSLVSKNKITMIFSKPFEGYQLVGATLVGADATGISGKNQAVCELSFLAKKNGKLSDMSLSLSDVKVVKDDLTYDENVTDWTVKMVTQGTPTAQDPNVMDAPQQSQASQDTNVTDAPVQDEETDAKPETE